MSMQTLTNGKPRKQLSDQLDRLDAILDVLAEGLPGAVADAAREGTRQAVKDAILEILSNPELRSLLVPLAPAPVVASPAHPAAPSAPPAVPSAWAKFKTRLGAARAAAMTTLGPIVSGTIKNCSAFVSTVTSTVRNVSQMLPWRRIALVGAGAGVTVGMISYLAPHVVSAVIGGIGGAATAVAVQLGVWARRFTSKLGFA